jgi:uncharacterized protein (TIGR00297 family)
MEIAGHVSVNRFTGGMKPVSYHTGVRIQTDTQKLAWQSKLILGVVVAPIAVSVTWEARFWATHEPRVAAWSLGLSALLGLLAWRSRSATPAAAATGALLCASMMFSTFVYPYEPWKTAIAPVLAVLVLTSLATRFGRKRKERLGTAEEKHGRVSAQVCANLGFAALVCTTAVQNAVTAWSQLMPKTASDLSALAALACLSEAAADTVSSEIGQVLGGQPFLLTTMRRVSAGTDGAISFAGTLTGIFAAGIIAAIGAFILHGWWMTVVLIWSGGAFGLLFDSLLGATLERWGWLNNDTVNFLSTASAAAFALAAIAWIMQHIVV